MRKILLIALLAVFVAGCSNNSGRVKEKTFAQQIAELEREGAQPRPGDEIALQTAAEREAEVALAAQKERRAQAPLVESNYIFQVMPDKGVYSFDEYNQVWTGAPQERDYKDEKRLWTKPKRYKGDYEAPSQESASPPSYQDEDDDD